MGFSKPHARGLWVRCRCRGGGFGPPSRRRPEGIADATESQNPWWGVHHRHTRERCLRTRRRGGRQYQPRRCRWRPHPAEEPISVGAAWQTPRMTSSEPLAGLDDIAWSGLEHAYGEATDVPDLLRTLVSDDVHERQKTIYQLYGNIFHQGTRYQATAYAVPFLARLALDPGTFRRAEIVDLLGAITVGYDEVYLPARDRSGGAAGRLRTAPLRPGGPAAGVRRVGRGGDRRGGPAAPAVAPRPLRLRARSPRGRRPPGRLRCCQGPDTRSTGASGRTRPVPARLRRLSPGLVPGGGGGGIAGEADRAPRSRGRPARQGDGHRHAGPDRRPGAGPRPPRPPRGTRSARPLGHRGRAGPPRRQRRGRRRRPGRGHREPAGGRRGGWTLGPLP